TGVRISEKTASGSRGRRTRERHRGARCNPLAPCLAGTARARAIRRTTGDRQATGSDVDLAILQIRRLRPGLGRRAVAVVLAQDAAEYRRREAASGRGRSKRPRLVVAEPHGADELGRAPDEPDVL